MRRHSRERRVSLLAPGHGTRQPRIVEGICIALTTFAIVAGMSASEAGPSAQDVPAIVFATHSFVAGREDHVVGWDGKYLRTPERGRDSSQSVPNGTSRRCTSHAGHPPLHRWTCGAHVMQIAPSYCFAKSDVKLISAATAKIFRRGTARETSRIDISSGGSHALLRPHQSESYPRQNHRGRSDNEQFSAI